MGAGKVAGGEGQSAEGGQTILKPVALKVRHKVAAETWIFEDQSGQLYLATTAPGFRPGIFATYSGGPGVS